MTLMFLHASTPSNHVCSKFESPGFPQFLNQAPPPAQQLSLPDLLLVPHLGHTIAGSIFDVVAGDMGEEVETVVAGAAVVVGSVAGAALVGGAAVADGGAVPVDVVLVRLVQKSILVLLLEGNALTNPSGHASHTGWLVVVPAVLVYLPGGHLSCAAHHSSEAQFVARERFAIADIVQKK